MGLRMRLISVLLAALGLLGCASEVKDRSTPANAFARLAPCVDKGDARCVYVELDRASRWSIQTIHKILVEMRALVDGSYPIDRRTGSSIYGAWETAAAASDDAGTFAAFCVRRGCMAEFVDGFGAVVSVNETGGERAEITTTRGRVFAMASADGAWGLSTYGDELAAEKIRLADKLSQVRIDARAFDEQRRATGAVR
jgi:hypothetical protein